MAYQPEHVASRLPVYSARRKSVRRTEDVSEPDADDAARGPMARRKLDLRRLGWHSWRRLGYRAFLPTAISPRGECRRSRFKPVLASGLADAHCNISSGLLCLDIFSRAIGSGSV